MSEITNTEFFEKLSDKLDELFPKGDKRRGDGLVLNAWANIFYSELRGDDGATPYKPDIDTTTLQSHYEPTDKPDEPPHPKESEGV